MGIFYVYLLANLRGVRPVLYVGVTNDLQRRLHTHRNTPSGFVAKYHVDSLVLVERFSDVRVAIAREKEIKGWRRAKKIALIEKSNPGWRPLVFEAESKGTLGGPSSLRFSG